MKKILFRTLFFLILVNFVSASSAFSSQYHQISDPEGGSTNHFISDCPSNTPTDPQLIIEEMLPLPGENNQGRSIIDTFILNPGDSKKMVDPDFCLIEADASLDPGIIIK